MDDSSNILKPMLVLPNRLNDLLRYKFSFSKFIFLFFGGVLGLLWLLPSYAPPEGMFQREAIEMWRVLRLVFPFLVALIGLCFDGIKRQVHVSDVLLFTVFFIWPQVCWILNGTVVETQYYINAPFLVSGLTIYFFSFWNLKNIENLLVGLASVGAVLVLFRISLHGLEVSTFYFRPRWTLGFSHPLVTASAVCCVSLSLLTLQLKIKGAWIRTGAYIANLIVAFLVLYKVDSKNTSIFAINSLFVFFLLKLIKNRYAVAFLFSFATSMTGIFVILAATSYGFKDIIAQRISASSFLFRLNDFQLIFEKIKLGKSSLIGVSKVSGRAFAVSDSVFTSIWHHYGLIGLLAFVGFLLNIGFYLGRSLRRTFLETVICSTFLPILIFFLFDAQGISAANFFIFILFSSAFGIAANFKKIELN